jgi:APA family basic amino acid/polyamine antiporter
MDESPTLKRSLGLPLITLYGLGTVIGAGIFVLIGEVAGSAGMFAPVAFLVASLLAGLTAFSFAELASRFPKSAGEAVYVQEGFGWRPLSVTVGLLVALAGMVSCATIAIGFVGYLHEFIALPDWLVVVAVVLGLGTIAVWGIVESVTIAALITIVEAGTLVVVVIMAGDAFTTLPARLPELLPPAEGAVWSGILGGSVLAFFAFIGFEDMVNVAEEVKDAPRVMPRAIITVLIAAMTLYVAVSLVAVLTVPPAELAASGAPVALIFERATGLSAAPVSAIVLVAVLNGDLIQIVMAARVFYGLANMGLLPGRLATVNARTRTPLMATALATAIVLGFALWLPLLTLAQLTSLVTLVVFVMINLALVRIKRRSPPVASGFTCPLWVPVAGFVASAGFAAFQIAGFAGFLS